MVAATTERRRASSRTPRSLPWAIAAIGLLATLTVTFFSRQAVQDEQDAALEASTSLFQNTIDETETRLGLEQSKLLFMLKGVASFAATHDVAATAPLDDYMMALPVEQRLPALQVVTLIERTAVDVGALRSTVTPTGEPISELDGLELASLPGLDHALGHSLDDSMVHLATMTSDEGSFVWLVAPVPGQPEWFVGARFVGQVFLSPALGAGGTVASLEPTGAEFVIHRPGYPLTPFDRLANGQVGLTPDGQRFDYAGEVTVFGATWRLDIMSSPDFLEIPENREYRLWLLGGLIATAATTALVAMRQQQARRQIRASEALTKSSRRFTTGFDNAPIGMAEVDADGTVIRANETMKLQLGRDDLTGVALPDLVHPDDAAAHEQHRRRLDRGLASSAQLDIRYVRPTGDAVWVTESVSALDRVDDPERHFLVQQLDTTDRHRAEAELHRRAFTDELTGLPNRAALVAELEHQLAVAQRTGEPVALFFIDVDRFKVVNDSLGHSAGDQLLRIIARRIVEQVPDRHMVGRFGGDEFVIVCPGVTDPDAIGAFANVLLEAVRAPIELADAPVQITSSIGLTFSTDTATAETLLRDADAAMYKAKARGRNVVQTFGSPIREEAVERLLVERSLRQALERDEFEVWFQPMVDLNSDRVVGVEALLRWRHPERGLLQPSQFLGVAKEAGLLDEIDRRTLTRAWSELERWSSQNEYAQDWHLSVNCSPKWLLDGRLRSLLPTVLAQSDVDPGRLWLEVTESDLLSDGEHARAELAALHDLGVKVAIDDFGTGFSSLSYLSRFEVDQLKIDRSFISSLGESTADEAIVSAVVEMAGALGIATVAEGTESAHQLETVRRLGADYAQGYLLSRPLSGREMEQALARLG